MPICFMCEEEKSNENLQNHHLIPGFLVRMDPFEKWEKCGGTVKLCPKCHKKITWMLGVIELVVKEGLETEEVK
ncbi:hypothetical protein AKJ64_00240 [candidate division MSBL1 archaeon SCGC-AAA259E17]|uniref:HNH domain-containing protein n=1 Tax=candidate division MSBL1 archaeon SCGC-AAA259E17 TaxID=1698263 RepID=A0A133UHP0_9EURY|nr:hypothetical protein AKJ64_00240 [candidate division MSBL1 archaeon SCGC-AAA259E17]